jgi:AcrR family transcriptional regulator
VSPDGRRRSVPARRTQQSRVDESSRRLAAAAVELINEKGYTQTSAREIGVRAGYSRAMVAERFGGMDGLLDVLFTDYEKRIAIDVPDGATGFEKALAPLHGFERFAAEDPSLLRAMLIVGFEATHDHTALRERLRQWLPRLRGILRDGMEAGQRDGSVNPAVNAAGLSFEIVTTGIGYAYWSIVSPEQIDLDGTLRAWRERVARELRPVSD